MMRYYFMLSSILIAGFLAGCGEKIEPGTTPPGAPVVVTTRTAVVASDSIQQRYEAVGTVKPKLFSTLSGKVMGTVVSVNVDEGQQAKKGQLLVALSQLQINADHDRALAALEEARRGQTTAEASVRVAKANADLAKNTYERYQTLVSGESASPQELDEVKAKYEAAMAAVAQAEAMLAGAKKRVVGARAMADAAGATAQDMFVHAPYDGVIIEKLVEPGDLVSPGRPLLRLEGFEGYRVVFVLEETRIQAVRVGQVLAVEIESLADSKVQGTVESISPVADVATRSVEVKLALPSIPDLRSGFFARVFIPGGTTKILRIPKSAIVQNGQLTGVYKVDNEGLLRFRLVRTGRYADGQAEILSGMKADERYVVAPGPDVKNGRLVKEAP